MRSTFFLLAGLILCLASACNRSQANFVEALIGEWEVVDVSIVGDNSGAIAPGPIGGVLRLINCEEAPTFNPCPATFTAPDGDVYELEWAAALDFNNGADFLELDFVGDPNDFEDDIIADLLNRPWNIDLRGEELDMELAHVRQTGPALGFERLAEAAVSLSKR